MDKTPTDEQVQSISSAVSHGNTIEAIKLYRDATGKGLKDAKDFIEELKTATQTDEQSEPIQQSTPIGVIIFLVLLTLGAGVALTFASFRAMSLGKQSESWPSARGTMVLVRGRDHARDIPAKIEYSYIIDGKRYKSETYTYRHHASRAVPISKYKQGQKVTVYYNPSHPKLAVLLPGFEPHILRPLVGLVCLMISIYLAGKGIREHKQRNC